MSSPHPHPDPDCEALADTLGSPALPPGSSPPAPPVRDARLFAWGDGWLTRLDTLIERATPRALNPLAHLGPATNAMLLLATLSGVLMLLWYSPSVQFAWSSLAHLGPRSFGGVVRSVHRYSSDLSMLLGLLHALRTLLARKFADARWLAWVSGLAILGLVWFIGWTGYWLVWDERAQLVAHGTMKAVDVLPIFGEPMLRLLTTDRTVPSLLFFVVFFLHMVLPLAIAGGLALHLARLSRAQLLPDRRLSAALVAAVIAAALIYPAGAAAAAQMAVKPALFTMDWWFLWPLAFTTRFTGPGIWLATALTGTVLATVPWWLARRRPRPTFQATVNPARCFSCTLCTQDCPFGAITMVPRTDGKPWPSQAEIDPERCIGCGICAGACDTQAIGLPWFDALQVRQELETFVAAEVARGTPPALALVCAQNNGGWELFARAAWERRLPGYAVRPIPCAGWVEPKIIERLLGKGATAVLVVGCSSGEAFCREGNVWLPARLDGTREPAFRPNRADPHKTALVNFDPLRPLALTEAARQLLVGAHAPAPTKPGGRVGGWLATLLVTAGALAALLIASDAPFRNPAPTAPEFVFTFRAYGHAADPTVTTAIPPAEDHRPIHMRGNQPAQRTRQPVVIHLEIDGHTEEHIARPKGLTSDGLSVGEVRVPLTPGTHRATVRVTTGDASAPPTWTGEWRSTERRQHVLSFDPESGFRWEP